jgi:flagellar hook assembly protein FlgD
VTAITNKERQTSGEHKYVWDGKEKNGKTVSTGIYFYELYVDDYRESKAMIMVK